MQEVLWWTGLVVELIRVAFEVVCIAMIIGMWTASRETKRKPPTQRKGEGD